MRVVDGTIGEALGDHDGLVHEVYEELIALRGQWGRLTPQKFAGYPALVRVCGGGDLLDAYLLFERELRRYQTVGRDEAAAAISITAPADTVLDRLEHAVGHLPQDGRLRDQRTARRWSDRGLEVIAADLVYFAEVQGRLGTELLSIEIHDGGQRELRVIIDQMSTATLDAIAPLVRLWRYIDDEPQEDNRPEVDLEPLPVRAAEKDGRVMRRHHVHIEIPEHAAASEETLLIGLSIEGRDAPMRTVAIEDHRTARSGIRLRFSVYRTIALIDVIVVPS